MVEGWGVEQGEAVYVDMLPIGHAGRPSSTIGKRLHNLPARRSASRPTDGCSTSNSSATIASSVRMPSGR